MGSQLLSILRQGFWASLTGGWFYDQRQAHFVNVFHLYIWLLLLCLPLSVQIFVKNLLLESFLSWSIYCVFVSVLFVTVKLINAYLHHLYDTGECVAEDEDEEQDCFEENKHKDNRESFRVTNSQIINQLNGNYAKREEEANVGSLADDIDFARSLMSDSCTRMSNLVDQESNRLDSIPLKLMTSTRVNSNDELVNNEQSTSVINPSTDIEDGQKAKDSQDTKSLQCNITMNPSVIDLEVDVHHRNSSGSSIVACGSVSSSSAASGRLTTTTTVASGIALTPGEANDSIYDESRKPSEDRSVTVMRSRASADSLSNGSSEEVITTQSASSEALLKGASYGELGFMAQDPSVMRNIASGSHQESQLRTFKPNVRGEAGFAGRRARSELETTNYYGGDAGQGAMPPSHPVSLEVIGSCETGDLRGNANERLNRAAPKKIKFSSVEILNNQRRSSILPSTKSASVVSDTINPIDELSSDEQLKQDNAQLNQPPSPLSPTLNLQESFDSRSPEEGEDYKPVFADDEEQETDVSLVVNISKKHALQRKRVVKKGFRPKFGKQMMKKSKVGGDNLLMTSPSDDSDESEDSGESSGCTFDECWPRGRTSISSTQSETNSDNEKTPLTASMNESGLRPRICRTSNSKSKLQGTPLSPAGPSHENTERLRDAYQSKDIEKLDADLKKLRLDIDKRSKRYQHQLRRHREHRDQNRFKKSDGCSDEIQEGYQQLSGTEAGLTPSPIQTLSASASEGPPAYLLARILATPGTHLAKSHDDTSPGAVHCFQDERGNWLTYIFDENSHGTARGLMNSETKNLLLNYPPTFAAQKWDSSSSSSDSNVVLDAPANILHTPRATLQTRTSNSTFHNNETTSNNTLARFLTPSNSLLADSFPITAFSPLRSTRRIQLPSMISDYHPHTLNSNVADLSFPIQLRFPDFASPEPTPPKRKQYYKLWIPPCFKWKYVKIWFDRLQLLALLDRSLTKIELVMSILLAVLVAVLGSIVIEKGYFQDLWLFLFCFVIASCHYTLLKSVQPDAASPTHGYNRVIIYSRPVYFIIGCSLICFCEYFVDKKLNWSFVVYGINLFNSVYIHFIGEIAKVFVLAFPLVFTVGLMPQINTFIMHLMEQTDIHIFGGTAATMGLTSSFYCIFRSIATVALLFAFALISTTKIVGHSKVDYDVVFSVFCGFLVFFAYHLSRSSSDPTVYWNLVVKYVFKRKDKVKKDNEYKVEETNDLNQEKEYIDPLPEKLEKTLLSRLENDIILSVLITIFVFAIHVSTIFTLQPYVEKFLQIFAVCWGLLLHYFLTNFRKELPWLCFAQPTLKSKEYDMFEVKGQAKLMWFERVQAWMWLIERNFIYPLVFLSAITTDTPVILNQFGVYFGTLMVVVCTFKCIRSSFNDSSHNHLILLFTYLFFKHDFAFIKEPFLINFFMTTIAYHKFYEFLLKIRFVITYVAPWQITWGSAFHAFAQPFNVPHSGLLFVQAAISSLFSSPLQPLLGSAIFLMSYVRPVKFWERDYNTKRVDNSNTRLINQLERNQLGNDDNNLNSIFYEHLTRSLQHSLYGDVFLGRWGPVSQGDCFVLASDNLNCLLHVIELGNGLLTFQVRGLEFRGTYCQQREVEAISEGVNEDEACCCCEPGHLPGMLSLNAAFNQRWLAWEVTNTKYVLEGYSISDNSALSMLQPYDLRKALITYYVKSVIYFTVINKRLDRWCKLAESMDKNFIDLDITFNVSVDEDYDFRVSGITKSSFSGVYSHWIKYCMSRRNITLTENEKDLVVTLCFYLSLLARRALSAASHHNSFNSVEFLLYGLHSLFKGDFRVTSPRDEWVFQDINLLNLVIAPSVRMAVKLHQDHFMSTDEYDDDSLLYSAITTYREEYVISHEADPVWRNAVLSNVPSLLALRHVFDDGTDQYKIIMLNKRYLSFRVIKVNRECVRGLWAGQQQELVYLRNRNPERGSIQNAKQALRNIINSSCDQPIGYPIYVSPLTTSFAETNDQLAQVIGKPLSFGMFKRFFARIWNRLRTRCGEGCSSGGTGIQEDTQEEFVMRSMSSISTCRHRPDLHRGLHRRDSGNEYETPQLLQSKSKAMRHPSLTYQHLQLNKDLTITSSTLVNLSAFRPLETEQRDAVVVL